MKKVETAQVVYALNRAAEHQFGKQTRVTVWWREDSPHGSSYRGYNYHTNRWLQVDLDFAIGTVVDAS